jgi:glycosyltransferase involved in cell wall biosynthesis
LFSPYFVDKRIGFINSFLNRVRLFISKFTLGQAQVIRVVSEKIADSLVEKGIDKDKIILKPIEVNVENIKQTNPSFNLREKFPQFSKIIVMASRIESEKNIKMAIEAMKIVRDYIPTAGLIIVGSGGKTQELKELTFKLKIEANTVFVGWQSDLIPYYKGCDVFLVTSWFEGYGMTFKEAQAANCRIVSTDVGIAREVGAKIVGWDKGEIAKGILDQIK